MRKLFVLLCLYIAATYMAGCTDCNDCGPVTCVGYHIENQRTQPVTITWFDYEDKITTVIASKQDTLIYSACTLPAPSFGLPSPPFYDNDDKITTYDSVWITDSQGTKVFKPNDCTDTQNVLCAQNHEVIFSKKTKKEKSTSYKFVLK